MPKPTFFQAVLRKPTRSYADPHYVPPWSDNYDYDREEDEEAYSRPASRYSSRMDNGVFLGYQEGHYEPEAGPSRPRKTVKAPRSVISTVSEDATTSPRTRFPKAARRVASSVVVRGGHVVEILDERDDIPSRSSTIKKKKARSRRGSGDAESTFTASRPVTPAASTRSSRRARRRDLDSDDGLDGESVVTASRASVKTPSLQSRNRLQPSESSSSSFPVSLRDPSPVQRKSSNLRPQSKPAHKDVVNGKTPLTPPSSLESSRKSSTSSSKQPPQDDRQPQSAPDRPAPRSLSRQDDNQRKRVSVVQEETDGDEFFTPRQSMDVRPKSTATIPAIAISQAPENLAPPTFNIQPPTPAPVEVDASPFHSEPSSTASSLHPDQAVQPINPQPYFETGTPSRVEEDAHTVVSEVGSDEEEVAERKTPSARRESQRERPPSFSGRTTPVPSRSRPASVAQSVPSGSVNGDQRPKRPSVNTHGPGFARRYSTPLSEVSYGGKSVQSAREGSIRSSVSGFGKGGWAAAAAMSTPRSDAGSPVMYMPSGGNDGWGSFHVPPPPRQSKFTPLPSASQPMNFDRLVRDHPIAQSAPASRMGDRPDRIRTLSQARSAQSSVSSYSQPVEEQAVDEGSSSEDEDLPLPSRSYARPAGDSPSSEQGQPFGTPSADSAKSSTSQFNTIAVPPVPPPKNPSRGLMAQLSQYGSDVSLNNSQVSEDSRDRPTGEAMYQQQNGRSMDLHNNPRASRALAPLAPPIITPDVEYSPDQSQEPSQYSTRPSSPTGTRPTSPSMSRPNTPGGRAFETPSFLNPDVLTLLPEMTPEDSARLYQSAASESGRGKRSSWTDAGNRSIKRSSSLWGGRARSIKSEYGRDEDNRDRVHDLPPRSQSVMGLRKGGSKWGGSSYGDGQLMGSDGVAESVSGYTNLILPSGAYNPLKPSKSANVIDPKVLGLPHATMAAITLSTSAHRLPMTPMHLRANLPPPVDFSSHLKPPSKTGDNQLLVQVYAVAVDHNDVYALEEKTPRDVGKWVPGRSFVGRCLMVGAAEKDIVRGDIVIGLLDIRKSGALAEYILVDRRRIARAPYPTSLTLEQLALLPLEGIAATRAIRTHLVRHSRALIMDAHTSVGGLICQEMSRAGVYVVALIGGGENHHEAQTACMRNGAKGVMTGSPAAVMNGLDEWGWDFVFDTAGGPRVYEAAKRILKDQATMVSTASPEPSMPANAPKPKMGGFKAFRNAFKSRKKDQKFINYEYLPASGSGEPEVDSSGVDCRDVLEEPCMLTYRPEVRYVYPLERGMEAFQSAIETSVVRLIN